MTPFACKDKEIDSTMFKQLTITSYEGHLQDIKM